MDGYKTYIVAALMIAVVAAEAFLGLDVPGVDVSSADALEYILAALGLGTLRAGVAKSGPAQP